MRCPVADVGSRKVLLTGSDRHGVTGVIVVDAPLPAMETRSSDAGHAVPEDDLETGALRWCAYRVLAAEVLRRARHAELRGEVALLKRPRHGG
jgi:hypothetical protein